MRLTDYLRDNAPFLTTGAMLTFLSSFGQTYFISLFAGEVRLAFDLSHGAWGGIYMIGTMASAALMVWAGGLTDIFRVRILAPIVLTGLALASLAMALNPWVWALPFIVFALRFFRARHVFTYRRDRDGPLVRGNKGAGAVHCVIGLCHR